ncbi:MAG: prepilin peptidase [Pseudomonadota bacterium]
MIMEPTALAIAMAGLVPLLVYVMWSDMKTMRIPNMASLLIFLVFIPTGLMGLPIEVFGWRLLHTAIAFAIAFGLFQIAGGRVGGGDLKLVIALTPYVPGVYLGVILVTWSAVTLVSLAAFYGLRLALAGRETGYVALERTPPPGHRFPYFPAGVSIGISFILYFALALGGRI